MSTRISPLTAFTLALALGILVAEPLGWVATLPLLGLPVALLAWMRRRSTLRKGMGAFEVVLLGATFGLGAVMGLAAAMLPANHVANFEGKAVVLEGVVADGGVQGKNSQRAILECEGAYSGKVLLQLPASMPLLAHHSRIRVEGMLAPLPAYSPGYARYLRTQGVLQSMRAAHLVCTGRSEGPAFWAGELREQVSTRLAANMQDERMAGLAQAMFVGDRSHLDAGLRADFAATGLSHILSISGMHVTLFYLFLNFMLGFMGRRLATRHLRTFIILAALMVYLAMAGFGPAVCRAVFMLSCLRLAELFFVQKDSLNILAFTALALLLIDPLLIHDLGFQLSYLAVIGLILVSPRIEALMAARAAWLPQSIRSALAMSFAAQLLTTPLVLWHFGQFPAYFLLANLILLPAVTVATYLGIGAMLFCWVPGLGWMLGLLLDNALWIVAEGSALIAQLPGAVCTQASLRDPGFLVALGSVLLPAFALFLTDLRKALTWAISSMKGSWESRMQPLAVAAGLVLAVVAVA